MADFVSYGFILLGALCVLSVVAWFIKFAWKAMEDDDDAT